jgi:hypothetical protein
VLVCQAHHVAGRGSKVKWSHRRELPQGRLLGAQEPSIYRKRPHEAYTARAYSFLRHSYRAFLWFGLVAIAIATVSVIGFILTPTVKSYRFVAVGVVLLMLLGLLRLAIKAAMPDQFATSYEADREDWR